MDEETINALLERGRAHIQFVWQVREEMIRAVHERARDQTTRICTLLNPGTVPEGRELIKEIAMLASDLDIKLNFSLERTDAPAS